MSVESTQVNEEKLHEFMGQMLADLGIVVSGDAGNADDVVSAAHPDRFGELLQLLGH